ncbi:MAG: DUF1501 domain-containing protein [Verrucomicrobia subdivision 3 bacterium]|nr:DUF1501 domain-containing protein [Limisphaerales bacterium]
MSERLDIASMTRRDWIAGGGALAGAMMWPGLLEARAKAKAPAKQVIVIFLQGGLSHYESFDPKPEAPTAYKSTFGDIRTSVPGVRFAEHLPMLAKRMHKFNLMRGAFVGSPSHETAIHMTLTGWTLKGANTTTKDVNRVHPGMGAVVAKECGGRAPGLPGYVTVPQSGQLGVRVHYGTSGQLGKAFEPMDSGMPSGSLAKPFAGPKNLTLDESLSTRRLADRLALLRGVDHLAGVADGLDAYSQRAAEMLAGGTAGGAFDLSREPLKVRERYGAHTWGQQALLARRLAEAGVPYTLVNFNLNQSTGQDWDNHRRIFDVMKNKLLPPTDRAISALLDDLDERGLLDSTLVAVYGEFGRTPKINKDGGRDHWNQVCSVMLAGGGLKRGVVVGSSTKAGDVPKDRPTPFNDILATMYHQLGVAPDQIFHDLLGRPFPYLPSGRVIGELI